MSKSIRYMKEFSEGDCDKLIGFDEDDCPKFWSKSFDNGDSITVIVGYSDSGVVLDAYVKTNNKDSHAFISNYDSDEYELTLYKADGLAGLLNDLPNIEVVINELKTRYKDILQCIKQ